MIIETKYNVGDEVWPVTMLKPQLSIVTDISVSVHGEKLFIEYGLKDWSPKFFEADLFGSKEQLRDHLRDKALAKVDALFVEEVAE